MAASEQAVALPTVEQQLDQLRAENETLRKFARSYLDWHNQVTDLHQRKPNIRTETPLPGMCARFHEATKALAMAEKASA